ncbi:MAG: transcription termination factor NusA [Clostridiales bacterium]|nr:transcription termination factor NusA [Clostridiales bacterium]
MAKRAVKKGPTPEEDAKEFFAALDQIEEERGIPKSYMLEKIEQALLTAYKHDHDKITDNVSVIFDEEKSDIRMVVRRDVVEEVDNPDTEISLEDARQHLPSVQLGDVVKKEIKIKNFGRVAAQTARQVIVQGIREAERNMVFDAFNAKAKEMLSGTVSRTDPRTGALYVRLNAGKEKTDALLSANEQVRGEYYKEGDRIRVYVVEVRRTTRGTQVVISRTHAGLVKRLFELEVPEIFDGVVEIKSIAREAGSRTKMAVWSNDPEVDPIGACVGTRGARVSAIVEELHGEKVDIIKYNEDMSAYIAAALAPASVLSVTMVEEKSYRVVVPDDQLSLAIGKEGQNARLAARLTGCKIDIKSLSAAQEEEAQKAAQAEAEAEESPLLDAETEALFADEAEAAADQGDDLFAPEEDAPAEEPEE